MTGSPRHEDFHPNVKPEGSPPQWQGKDHPLAGEHPPEPHTHASAVVDRQGNLEIPPAFTGFAAAPSDMPAPVQQAVLEGKPIRFSSAAENQQAHREPDYYLTPQGKLVANPSAKPSADGSINIEIQSQDQQNNKSLKDAIQHETENQRAWAKDMIRLWQKDHPNQQPPSWMQDLANAKPNLPDFIPFNPAPNAPAAPPPENNFVSRGVSNAEDGGFSGFAGNGGFDSNGYFQGTGTGDGTLSTGGMDSHGQPLGAGEQVQAKQLYDFFLEHGFSPAQASGILGNIQTESSFRTNAYNSNEGAIGLCQWEGSRRVALEQFAQQDGQKYGESGNTALMDWRVQADFIIHELNTSESGAMAALKAAQTPEQAAIAFQSQYERSASLGNRAANADNIYHQLA